MVKEIGEKSDKHGNGVTFVGSPDACLRKGSSDDRKVMEQFMDYWSACSQLMCEWKELLVVVLCEARIKQNLGD